MFFKPRTVAVLLLTLIAAPAVSRAQVLGSIAGVVRDESGAVLPGVTIEAASPALIEKVRAATSNGSGQYAIVNLPVGVYTVTFTLTGFNTSKREGVEVAANFVATVSTDLKVGALEETINVVADSPIVDVQSASQTRAVTPEIIKAIPNGGTMYQLASMMPAVTITGGPSVVDVGGSSGSSTFAQLAAHGGSPNDEVQMLDGLKIGSMASNAGRTGFSLSPLLWDQIDIQLSGQGGDSPTLGVQTNAIPRAGGNSMSGTILANGTGNPLQSNNLTGRLQATSPDLTQIQPWGLTSTSTIKPVYDLNGSVGGPLVHDKLWFYSTGRYQSNTSTIAGLYFPVDPAAIVRTEDTSRPAYDDQYVGDVSVRVTAAVTQKMRATLFADAQHRWQNYWAITANFSPESVGRVDWRRWFLQGTWSYTATSRILFEAGANYQHTPNWILPRPGEPSAGPRIAESGGTLNGQAVAAITHGSFGATVYDPVQNIIAGKGSMSYVTGSHTAKIGMDLQHGYRGRVNANFADDVQYRTTAGVLNQVTIFVPSGLYTTRLDYNVGIYAQDRWTLGRLSVNGAARIDLQKESYDDFSLMPTKYTPNRPVTVFPGAEAVNWKEINPRMGAAYDLFGNGRTALKLSIARGNDQEGLNTADFLAPANALATSTARTVTDNNPRNNVPNCDLLNPLTNGECGPWLTSNFGGTVAQTQQDPATRFGWGKRPWNWEFSTGVQHEFARRMSVGFAYFRRINGGFLVTDNTANTAADFTLFKVTAPTDARLDSSAQKLTVADVNPVLVSGKPFNTTSNVRTFASNYGTMLQHWNGFDLTTTVRPAHGVNAGGGVTFGRSMTDNCDVIKQLPELIGPTPVEYCHNVSGWEPQYKAFAAYTMPWQHVRVSGNMQSLVGPALQAGANYTGSDLAPAIGRPFSAGAAGLKTVNVLQPQSVYGDRLNQLDLRFSRIFRIGHGSLDANVDLYNAFNSDAVLGYNTAYAGVNGGAWLKPTAIIQGRILKFGARWDF